MELYPLAKKPNVVEKRTSSATLPLDVRPQKRSALRAELMALMNVTAVADRVKWFLSLSQPKKVHAIIPGALKRVKRSVADVWDRSVTSCA